jgi:hypothetical protein
MTRITLSADDADYADSQLVWDLDEATASRRASGAHPNLWCSALTSTGASEKKLSIPSVWAAPCSRREAIRGFANVGHALKLGSQQFPYFHMTDLYAGRGIYDGVSIPDRNCY